MSTVTKTSEQMLYLMACALQVFLRRKNFCPMWICSSFLRERQ